MADIVVASFRFMAFFGACGSFEHGRIQNWRIDAKWLDKIRTWKDDENRQTYAASREQNVQG